MNRTSLKNEVLLPALLGTLLIVGCAGKSTNTAQPTRGEDPQVNDVLDRVNESLAARDVGNPRGAALPPRSAGGPPEIIWLDEASRPAPRGTERRGNPHRIDTNRRNARAHGNENPEESQNRSTAGRSDRMDNQEKTARRETTAKPTRPADRQMTEEQLLEILADRIVAGDEPALAKAMKLAAIDGLTDPDKPLDDDILKQLSKTQRARVIKYHRMVIDLGRMRENSGLVPDEVNEKINKTLGKPIQIESLALCRRVEGFGLYEEIDKKQATKEKTYVLYATQRRRFGIYMQLNHFKSILEADNLLTVRLQQKVTLYTEDGLPVWKQKPAEVVDKSRTERRDFFTTQIVELPRDVGVGKYLLKVSVTDHANDTIAEYTVPVHIVADRSVVGQ